MPTVLALQPNSLDMGSTAMLMLTRSMLQSMKAVKHRPTIVHRFCHLAGALATYITHSSIAAQCPLSYKIAHCLQHTSILQAIVMCRIILQSSMLCTALVADMDRWML